ncbi:MAG: hypothetical protein COA79_03025 [Planctomycetota bacterium]|nr:MAG: hypothetical protein COA79_03025 [Planctomycetota bacterium]
MDRKIIVLTEGKSNPRDAKTGTSLIRYRTSEVIAVLDKNLVGKTSQEVFDVGGSIPFVAEVSKLNGANTLLIGVAPEGGRLPDSWRKHIKEALELGMEIVSGLHDFLNEDPEFKALSEKYHARIYDVRKNDEKDVAHREGINDTCLRIHTVGQDCSVGKMVTSIEINDGLVKKEMDSVFVATGQTGIMIAGDGCPIDCVVSDFVNGAAEKLVLKNQDHDIIVVEGQGSLGHPSYSAVTLGLLHGISPHGMILCYEARRENTKLYFDVPLQPLEKIKEAVELLGSFMSPCKVIGFSVNTQYLNEEDSKEEISNIEKQFGLPACDVIRNGPTKLIEAVLDFRNELLENGKLKSKKLTEVN